MQDDLLTIQEAAQFFGVSPRTLRRWEEKGAIKPLRTVGNQRRYSKQDLANLFKTPEKVLPSQPVTQVHIEPDVSTSQPTPARFSGNIEEEHQPSMVRALLGGVTAGAAIIGLIILSFIFSPQIGTSMASFTDWLASPETSRTTLADSQEKQVLGASDAKPSYQLLINVPSVFKLPVTFLDSVTLKKQLTVSGVANLNGGIKTNNKDVNAGTGKITASNVIYSLLAGTNVSLTGDPQNPTISATGGVTTLQGLTGALNLTTGSGISLNGLELNNTGVTSFQGQTGTVTLTGGSGITVAGTTVSNTDGGSAQNIFKIITAGGTDITAGSNNDQLTFAAGSGITLTGDVNSKTVTITGNPTGFSGLTTDGVLYATSATTVTSTDAGTNGYILKSNGPGVSPTWEAPGTTLGFVPFDQISSGTNTAAAMIVGSGASFGFTGTGTINASSLNGTTFASPGAIGSTTPGTGAFTSLTGSTFNGLTITNTGTNTLTIATGKTLTVSNTLSLAGTDGTTFTFPSTSGTVVTTDATQTLTNKTIAAGSNTITGLTNGNLSGSAGITNANLANSSVTVNAGSGLSGGGAVALGGNITLTNNGVKSAAAGSGITIDQATGDITITNNGVTSAVAGTGIGVSGGTGAVTFTNLGVTSLAGTLNQVNVSGGTGSITLSLPQSINAGAAPTFAGLTLSALTNNGGVVYTNGSGTFAQTAVGSGGECLKSAGGGSPTWGACAGANYFQRNGTTVSPATTGDSLLLADSGTTSNYRLEVNGKQTGKALAVFNETGNQDIFTASASGTTRFTIANNGNVNAAGSLSASNFSGSSTGSNTGDVTLSGQNYLSIAGQIITANPINLSGTNITSMLGVGNGGTGVASLTSNGVLFGGATVGATTAGTDGQILLGRTGTSPAFGTVSGDGTISNTGAFTLKNTGPGAGSLGTTAAQTPVLTLDAQGRITSVSNTSIAIDAAAITSGTLPINRGGTNGTATPTAGALAYGTGTAYAFTTAGSNGDCLLSGGAGTPTWGTCAGANYLQRTSTTLAPAATGDSLLLADSGTTSSYRLEVNGKQTGKALAVFNETGNQAIFTASASGATRFTIANNGNVTATGALAASNFSGSSSGTNTGDVTLAGQNYLSIAGQVITANAINLSGTHVTSTLGVGNGGTGVGSLTTNGVLFGGATVGATTAGTDGQILLGRAGTSPAFGTVSGDATISNTGVFTLKNTGPGAGSLGTTAAQTPVLTLDAQGRITGVSNTSIAIDAAAITSGALAINRGGTNGSATPTAGAIAYGTGTAYAFTLAGSSNQCLLSAGAGTPVWGSCALGTNYLQRNSTTISPFTTGDSLLLADSGTTSNYRLEVNGKQTGKALAVFNETGNQDIFSASASGATKFTIANNGNVTAVGTFTASNFSGSSTGTNTGDVTLAGENYLSRSGQIITANAINLAGTNVSGILGIANGGTGSNTQNFVDLTTGQTVGGAKIWSNQATFNGGIAVAANQNLTLAAGTGSLSIGTISPLAALDVRGNSGTTPVASVAGVTAKAALVVDNSGVGDLFTASKSGATKFTIANNGNITAVGSLTASNFSGSLTGTNTGDVTLAGQNYLSLAGQVITANAINLSGVNVTSTLGVGNGGTGIASLAAGSLIYGAGTTNPVNTLAIGGANTVLTSNGSIPQWASSLTLAGVTPSGTTGTFGWLQRNAGALAPTNITDDLLIGGTATSSAKFSISGTTGNASSAGNLAFSTAASIQTTSRQTLTLGGNTTGDISFQPGGTSAGTSLYLASSGNVGIGTNAPVGGAIKLDVRGTTNLNFVTNPSVYGAQIGGGINLSELSAATPNAYIGVYEAGVGFKFGNNTGGTFNELMTLSGAGQLNLGTSLGNLGTPVATLAVNGVNGTQPVASISGVTAQAALVVDNSGVGDIFSASKSGATKLVITNAGNVGIGTSTPTALLDVAGAASVSGSLNFRTGAGAIQTTANNTLTIGGNTTGNINLLPQNGSATGIASLSGTLALANSNGGHIFSQNVNPSGKYSVSTNAIGNGASTVAVDNGNNNVISCSEYNSYSGGTINSLQVYYPTVGGGSHFKVAVYDATGTAGAPGNLLSGATAPSTNAVGGAWTVASLGQTVALAANTNYYLCFNVDSGSTTYAGTSGLASNYASMTYSSNFPSSFGAGFGADTFAYSIYSPYLTIADGSKSYSAFTLDDNGNVTFQSKLAADGSFRVNSAAGNPLIYVDASSVVNLDKTTIGNTLTLSGLNNNSGVLYTNGSGTVAQSATGSNGQFLSLVSGVPTWTSATTLNFFQKINGAISPLDITNDLLVGGAATSSAKFQVFGLTGNASSAGNLTFNTASSIQTTARQTLTLGGTTTGDISFQPGGISAGSSLYLASNGNVGIGTATPSTSLQVGGSITVNGDILPNASPTTTSTTQTTTSADTTGNVGQHTSIKIGSDGLPVISYYDVTNTALKVIKCSNASCSSSSSTIVDGNTGCPTGCSTSASAGQYSSLAIGTDGFPVISYYDAGNGDLKVVKCGNTSCSSGNTYTSIDTGIDSGSYSSIAVESDGFPIVSYYDATNKDLKVAKCSTSSCSSSSTTTVDSTGDVGKYSEIAIGTDGFPGVAYYEGISSGTCDTTSECNPKFAKCFNLSCTATDITRLDSSTASDDSGQYLSLTILPTGNPVISFYDSNTPALRMVNCYSISCDEWTSSDTDNSTNVGQYTSSTVGTDGLPVISYYDVTNGNLKVAKCEDSILDRSALDTSCLSGGAQNTYNKTVDGSANNVGQYTSIAIGTDGLPIVSYYDATGSDLKVVKCADKNCQNTTGGNVTGGSNIGNNGSFFNNIYASTFWGKNFQITAFDVAEEYAVNDTSIQPGDVVRVSKAQAGADSEGRGITIEKTDKAYDSSVLGIVSTNPAIKLGDWQDQDPSKLRPVALAGRIPVKIASDSAAITPGDYITSSSQPGRAMKATAPGATIGKALESWTPGSGKDTILMFASLSGSAPSTSLAEDGNLDPSLTASASAAENTTSIDTHSFDEHLASSSAFQSVSLNVDSLSSRVASLEANLNLLASGSALLGSGSTNPGANAYASTQELGLDKLDAKDVTVSNTLSVIGRTMLADVGITGKVNIGLLNIDGLAGGDSGDTQSFASINTSAGPLKLQSDGYNGIDFVHGNVTIDTSGNVKTRGIITAKKINITTKDVQSASLGTGTLSSGMSKLVIHTTAVTDDSKIFVTPKTATNLPLSVTSQKDGDSFTVEMTAPAAKDITFNWWIVN